MASEGSAVPAPAKEFPRQLAQGMLQDLLAKELDADFFPDDGTKQAAFAASREALPRRLALLSSQISAADSFSVSTGVFGVLEKLWTFIRGHPLVARIEPAFLDSSLWLETLSSFFKEACASAGQLLEGGVLVTAALYGIGSSDEPFSSMASDKTAQLIKLVKWWGDDVCGKRWGVERPWGGYVEVDARRGPLHAIAQGGLAAFVPLAVEKGCSVNGDFKGSGKTAPAIMALRNGHVDVVEALLTHGLDLSRPYDGDGWPLALLIFLGAHHDVDFLADIIRRYPDTINACTSDRATLSLNLLDVAVLTKDPAAVDLALSVGAKPQFGFRCAGDRVLSRPSLSLALMTGKARTLQLVITKGKVLEGWKDKYDSQALGDVSVRLAELAGSAYPSNPHYNGDRKYLIDYNPEAMECLELVLASGIVCPWNHEGTNSLLGTLYQQGSCVVEEKNALMLLRRYHSAGFDVVHVVVGSVFLPRLAVQACQPSVLDYCIGERGVSPEFDMGEARGERDGTLLAWALRRGSIPCVSLLLEKYKVRVAYPQKPLDDQPVVMGLLGHLSRYTDSEAERVLRALVERDRDLFAIPCFSEASIAERSARRARAVSSNADLDVANIDLPDLWNPVCTLAALDKRKALEFLLKSDIPGVSAMANRAQWSPAGSSAPAQIAAGGSKWACLELILRYTGAKVTETFGDGHLPAAELVRRSADRGHPAPRPLVAMVEARAKEELAEKAEKAKIAAASQAAGTVTNAFEDPSVKPLTEKEEKAKAKKKAAKKKAKAKRRAAARAGAGTTGVHDSSSDDDDDDDGPHEHEPDDNLVDSRNAPSLDLMLEQMGLKTKE